MAKAVNYALTHMPKLARYVNDGRFRPDNNDIDAPNALLDSSDVNFSIDLLLVPADLDFSYPINIIFIQIQFPAILRGIDCGNKTFTQLIVKNALFNI